VRNIAPPLLMACALPSSGFFVGRCSPRAGRSCGAACAIVTVVATTNVQLQRIMTRGIHPPRSKVKRAVPQPKERACTPQPQAEPVSP
jgi:hypothetical protein